MLVGPAAVWVVFSDIHGNFDALLEAVRDADNQAQAIGVNPKDLRYISLGDVVDYGPDPAACVDWVESNCAVKMRGNHDVEASKCLDDKIELVKKEFWPVTIWTRSKLDDRREQLQSWELPTVATLGAHQVALGHATLAPSDDRQDSNTDRKTLIEQLRVTKAPLGLIGHTHTPVIWVSDFSDPLLPDDPALPKSREHGWNGLVGLQGHWGGAEGEEARSILFNPGALGQPRCMPRQSLQPCAPYLLLDTRGPELLYKFCRARFSHEKTIDKLRSKVRFSGLLPKTARSVNKNKLSRHEIDEICARLDMELEDLVLALRTPPLRQGL